MTSKQALKRIKEGTFIKCEYCDSSWFNGCRCGINHLSQSKEIKTIEKDIELAKRIKKLLRTRRGGVVGMLKQYLKK